MSDGNYTKTIKANIVPGEVIDKIGQVSEWWSKNFEGKSTALNDVFTVRFMNGDMYKIKIGELIADKKIVWDVIDAYQSWVKEPTEWVGTKIVWEVSETKDGSEVHFTHIGLVPELECFDTCTGGWNYLMTESLSELLNKGVGVPV